MRLRIGLWFFEGFVWRFGPDGRLWCVSSRLLPLLLLWVLLSMEEGFDYQLTSQGTT
jgi:hypothetical protein